MFLYYNAFSKLLNFLITSSRLIFIDIDKEMSSHSPVLKTAVRVATASQPQASTSLSEGKISFYYRS